ncbi:MAG TPA: DUF4157 domain-containing protein [Enhygromyxa sp.]|nr:DUF4157 domain-containing protein [Enhygromyxa sp.]
MQTRARAIPKSTAINPNWVRFATRAQAKLEVGRANDPLEHEADRVADAVMGTPGASPAQPGAAPPDTVQRMCSECEEQAGILQRKPTPRPEAAIDGDQLDARVRALAGGRQLSEVEREFFEPRFGRDFGSLRIHSDPRAQALARSVGARAFTVGTDIVMGPGEDLSGTAGQRLLAHELAHVVQQTGGRSESVAGTGSISAAAPSVQRSGACGLPCPATRPASLPSGWIEYFGSSSVFHCGFWGMKEDCDPTSEAPQNECFYDTVGRLVDESHEYSGCRGTPNSYDSERSMLGHTFADDGGIFWSGLPAFWESRVYEVDRTAEDFSREMSRALDWREWVRAFSF